MPSVRGKGNGGRRAGAGRPPQYTTLRVSVASGRFPIALPVETIGQAQRLLLEYPECASVEDVIVLAVERLAAYIVDQR